MESQNNLTDGVRELIEFGMIINPDEIVVKKRVGELITLFAEEDRLKFSAKGKLKDHIRQELYRSLFVYLKSDPIKASKIHLEFKDFYDLSVKERCLVFLCFNRIFDTKAIAAIVGERSDTILSKYFELKEVLISGDFSSSRETVS